VTQGSTLTVDSTLEVASLSESITVTGDSPMVDTTTTKVGATFSGEALVGVPSSTDLWGNLAQTPGVRMQGYDVGGSHKSQQTGYDAFGIRGQNKMMYEGIDTTEGDTGGFFYADYYAVGEVAITAIGGDVESSSPGAPTRRTSRAAATASRDSSTSPSSRSASGWRTTSTTRRARAGSPATRTCPSGKRTSSSAARS
jgi:hypothetical protein